MNGVGTRVRLADGGWASLVAGSGKPLLELVPSSSSDKSKKQGKKKGGKKGKSK
eukprot:COSAG05_NODE_153_length_15894_cov_27.910415_2_plen_54_part_00